MTFINLLLRFSFILAIGNAASDCGIINAANPTVFKLKCCNLELFGIQCESSRVVKIDDYDVSNPYVYYDDLFPILGSLSQLTVISISAFRMRNTASLSPDIGNLLNLQKLAIKNAIDRKILNEIPHTINNCIQLQILQAS